MSTALPPPVRNGEFKPPAGAEHIYVKLGDGRHMLVRPLKEGAGVQLALIGKRGGLVEAAPVPLDSIPRFIHMVDGVSEIAWWARERFDKRRLREREKRFAAAHARNPFHPDYKGPNPGRWKTAPLISLDETYIVRPR